MHWRCLGNFFICIGVSSSTHLDPVMELLGLIKDKNISKMVILLGKQLKLCGIIAPGYSATSQGAANVPQL